MFLSLFAWSQAGLRIEDPVRTMLRESALTEAHDCFSSRIFAIGHELRSGNASSVAKAVEAALESDVCRGNIDLWQFYVRYCHSQKQLRSRAKEVFYRAIAACPWSKSLYMEAFTTLLGDMASSELRAAFNTLTTKGLRVHVDLDEFIAKWQGSGAAAAKTGR